MNLLSDEILNKYLDGELDKNQVTKVEETLIKSENDRKRFNVLKLIHKELTLMQEDKVSFDFTNNVMARVNKKFALPKQQNYFIISITSFLILLCIGIVVFISISIFSSAAPQTESLQITETVNRFGISSNYGNCQSFWKRIDIRIKKAIQRKESVYHRVSFFVRHFNIRLFFLRTSKT